MADPVSFIRLLEQHHQLDFLLKSPHINEEDTEELQHIWNSLKVREESKFDAIIGVIKECDQRIDSLEKAIKEQKNNQDYWKNKRNNIINIVKVAYEKQLISSKPTGNKYQATIKHTKSKLIDNFEKWTKKEKEKFGLKKKTTIKRIIDNKTLQVKEEELPDKEQIRKTITNSPKNAPKPAILIQRVSLLYGLRKRINKGI
tara:strand:- start:536 stop:1138 length:603 start_codon:yes stop_codon:yes gene_type:complete